MTLKNFGLCVLGLVLLVAANADSTLTRQNRENESLMSCAANENAAVRFFYNPPGGYFHFPLIFRSVEQADLRLNTAPMTTEGRTAYISFAEMRQLVEGLANSKLSWRVSEKAEGLGSYKKIPVLDRMEILVLCPKGTPRSKLAPKNICETLAPLDPALKTPRALWEFQLFRQGYGCKVPGFNPEAYPDR
jgi:hypothetical protein